MRRAIPLILVLLFHATAFACSCMGEEDVSTAKRRADGVFLGRVIRAERIEVDHRESMPFFQSFQMRYTFIVERRFKGRTIRGAAKGFSDTLVVFTGMGHGDCGFPFRTGGRYIVYGSDGDDEAKRLSADVPLSGRGIYWTSICTRSRPVDEAELRALE